MNPLVEGAREGPTSMSDSESNEEEGAGDLQAGILEGAGAAVTTEAPDICLGSVDDAGRGGCRGRTLYWN